MMTVTCVQQREEATQGGGGGGVAHDAKHTLSEEVL